MKRLFPLLVWLFLASALSLPALVICVAPGGNDQNDGTIENPLQSLEMAQMKVRELEKGKEDHFILIRGGRYELSSPLRFSELDGGVLGQRVVWKAFPGEEVRISGGRILSGWTKGRGGVWTAALPEGGWRFRELFVNGQRRNRARFPDVGFLRVAKAGEDRRTWFEFNEGDLPPLQNVKDLELVFLHDWSISRVGVKSIDVESRRVDLTHPVGCSAPHYAMDHFEKQPRYFLENSRAFLDRPGEWYLDVEEGQIHYLPLPGESMDSVEVVAPFASALIKGKGVSLPIRNLEFEDLILEHQSWLLPEQGYAEGQASYYEIRGGAPGGMTREFTPAAVHIENAEDCRMLNCTVQHVGGGGIWFGSLTRNCSVERCLVMDVSGNGVMFGEDRTRYVDGKVWHDSRPEQISTGNWLIDSEIMGVGRQFYGAVGVWAGIVAEVVIERNHIHHLPYTGISVGWMWNPTPTGARDNSVSWNHIHDVMLILSDGGGIYSLGHQPGSRFIGNRIHGVRVNAGRAESNGMFLDEGTTDLLIAGNTIFDIARSPLRFHRATTNLVERNFLVCGPGVPPIRYNSTKPETILQSDNVVMVEE